MASSPYSCVLWDVDGTIADASVGILRRLNVALTPVSYTHLTLPTKRIV